MIYNLPPSRAPHPPPPAGDKIRRSPRNTDKQRDSRFPAWSWMSLGGCQRGLGQPRVLSRNSKPRTSLEWEIYFGKIKWDLGLNLGSKSRCRSWADIGGLSLGRVSLFRGMDLGRICLKIFPEKLFKKKWYLDSTNFWFIYFTKKHRGNSVPNNQKSYEN